MLSHDQLQFLEGLRDDCDVLISILIRKEEVGTIPPHTAERIVKLIRQPRLLFDFADGWPALEEVTEAMGLEAALVDELASEVEILHAWTRSLPGPPTFAESKTRTNNIDLATTRKVIASLKAWSAEIPLWNLRQWLNTRIASVPVAPIINKPINASVSFHVKRPPPLQPFGDGASLGVRPVGGDRVGYIEAVLLERANVAHEAVLQAIKYVLTARGGQCFQSVLIDLACFLEGVPHIVEAKSISPDNEVEQVRSAFSQLRDYRFRHRAEKPFVGHEIGLWVALSSTPQNSWTTAFLSHEGVSLVWLGKDGVIAGPGLRSLDCIGSKHVGTPSPTV